MFTPNIRKRVLVVIDQKIDAAQDKHDADMEALEEKHEIEKKALTDSAVDSLIKSFAK